MKKGITNNSRRESNFIKRMTSENREQYIKRFIASCNAEQLIPFINITKHDEHFREIEYVISIPDEIMR
jgi:tagatose-1,6-bisphosphate aldolase